MGVFHKPVLRGEAAPAAPRADIAAIGLHQSRLRVVSQVSLENLVAQAVREGSSTTGKTTSQRSYRLRCIQSALPQKISGEPPFWNQKMRLCSRNRPDDGAHADVVAQSA